VDTNSAFVIVILIIAAGMCFHRVLDFKERMERVSRPADTDDSDITHKCPECNGTGECKCCSGTGDAER
jgi:hypothetical protein